MTPTQRRIKYLFDYDAETGIMTRRVTICSNAVAGRKAGSLNNSGYLLATVDGKRYGIHRLAWLWMTGEWPEWPLCEIDHIDGDPLNNRFDNLRKATRAENIQNSVVRSSNTSGHKGVSWFSERNKWYARIVKDGKRYHLGYFEKIEDAAAAYERAARELHGEFARIS